MSLRLVITHTEIVGVRHYREFIDKHFRCYTGFSYWRRWCDHLHMQEIPEAPHRMSEYRTVGIVVSTDCSDAAYKRAAEGAAEIKVPLYVIDDVPRGCIGIYKLSSENWQP